MLNLHPINYNDKDLFNYYLQFFSPESYEYTFVSLYLWRELCSTKVGVLYDTLVVQKTEEDKGSFFMMPYYKDLNSLYSAIEYLKDTYPDSNHYILGDIDERFLETLLSKYTLEILEDINHFEYIYLTHDLINLKGKKYHKKRNHYNNFLKLYNYNITDINNEFIINDCLHLLAEWEDNKCLCSKELLLEPDAVKNILFDLDKLQLKTIAVYVENNLAGFSIGEKLNDTAIIHIEKCNTDYRGIYAFINNEFLKRNFSDTIYVNRQEDCGSQGLQQSKISYRPYKILKKYLIKIKK